MIHLQLAVEGEPRRRRLVMATENVATLYMLARACLAMLDIVRQRDELQVDADTLARYRRTVTLTGHVLEDCGLTIRAGEEGQDAPV